MGGGTDIKPLRQEDYQALAEEVKELRQENARLKTPKVSWFKRVRWAKMALLFIAIVGGVSLLGSFIGWCIHQDDLSNQEKNAPPTCYAIAHSAGEASPWDKWYIWIERAGRNHWWEERALSADTEYGARYMLREWGLANEECRPGQPPANRMAKDGTRDIRWRSFR